MHGNRLTVVIAFAALRLVGDCEAQNQSPPPKRGTSTDTASAEHARASKALSFVVAAHAPVSNAPASAHDRLLLLLGAEMRLPLIESRLGSLETAPALYPGAYTTGNRQSELQPCGTFDLCPVATKYTAFGVGLAPLSLRLEGPPAARFRLALHAEGGGIWFARRVPAETGTHFNFLAQYGVDCRFRMTQRLWIESGYRHIHLSNGGTGQVNAGLDMSSLDLGLSWS